MIQFARWKDHYFRVQDGLRGAGYVQDVKLASKTVRVRAVILQRTWRGAVWLSSASQRVLIRFCIQRRQEER